MQGYFFIGGKMGKIMDELAIKGFSKEWHMKLSRKMVGSII